MCYTLTYIKPRLLATIDNWPATGGRRTICKFQVEKDLGSQRVHRTVYNHDTKLPMYTVTPWSDYAVICDGSDGMLYLPHRRHGEQNIIVYRSSMRIVKETIDKTDSRWDLVNQMFSA